MAKRPAPTKIEPVGFLCPSISEAMRIVRRHTPVGHPDRKKALDLLRDVQDGIHQLRFNANPDGAAPQPVQEASQEPAEARLPRATCSRSGCSRGVWQRQDTCRQHHPNRCIAINENSFNGGQRCGNINSERGIFCWKHAEVEADCGVAAICPEEEW